MNRVTHKFFQGSPASARVLVANIATGALGDNVGGVPTNPVISHNDGKVLKIMNAANQAGATVSRISAEDMAKELDFSMSHIYATLAKLGINPVEKKGKTSYYEPKILEQLKTMPRRKQRRPVPNEISGDAPSAQNAAPAPAEVKKNGNGKKEEAKSQEAAPALSLLQRLSLLEERLAKTEAELAQIKGFTGQMADFGTKLDAIAKVLGV